MTVYVSTHVHSFHVPHTSTCIFTRLYMGVYTYTCAPLYPVEFHYFTLKFSPSYCLSFSVLFCLSMPLVVSLSLSPLFFLSLLLVLSLSQLSIIDRFVVSTLISTLINSPEKPFHLLPMHVGWLSPWHFPPLHHLSLIDYHIFAHTCMNKIFSCIMYILYGTDILYSELLIFSTTIIPQTVYIYHYRR